MSMRTDTMSDMPLFTPGPLTTSRVVKQAMQRDLGSRDSAFLAAVDRVRTGLLRVANLSQSDGWESVLLQGSGTYAIEAVVSCGIPRGGKIAVCINGSYGRRIAMIAERHGIGVVRVESPENAPVDPEAVRAALGSAPAVDMLAVVHCETTTGLVNPVEEIGEIARTAGVSYFVDSMSAFGAIPIDLVACHIDWLVSSANKCIEGVPGFAFVLCRREVLEATAGWSRTVSLDLFEQWRGLERNGQFRFTPPTHAILAFDRALQALESEGGPEARLARYTRWKRKITDRMRSIGFEPYLDDLLQGPIITGFRYPEVPGFDFEIFYARLNEAGYVIYPGKVSDADCFRIGSIGQLTDEDVDGLLDAIERIAEDMGVAKSVRS